MKLIRLLASLTIVVAGLAAPAPAAAAEPAPARPLTREALSRVCTMLTGTYVRDLRASACEIGDGALVCTDTRCEYQVTALRERDLPPFQVDCETNRGTFRIGDIRGDWACELHDGTITLRCPIDLNPGDSWLQPWRDRQSVMICGITAIPSEQPMS